MPSASNVPGVDGYFDDGGKNVYAFQAAIAPEHCSPHDGLDKLWKYVSQDVRDHRTWHFIVVADRRDVSIECAKGQENKLYLGKSKDPVICTLAVLKI